jgi:tRNA(Ile)-lysidine synthase
MNLLAHVRRTIADYRLAQPVTRVVAAVSGGSDSIALVHILHELDAAGDLRLVGLVHFNHQLREAAAADERFVREAAERLAVPVFVERDDVRARAAREKRSIEDAARAARYECFGRARAHFDADAIAVGHTRDDQAETFLLRLLRGAGSRGLGGMYPRNGHVIRPLLDCLRDELRAWLRERTIAFVEDETNADVSIPRNRIRADLIPLLKSRFNPAIVDVLAGEADLAREAWGMLEASANEIEERIVKPTTNGFVIDLSGAVGVAPALRRVVLWRTMSRAANGRLVGFEHVAAAMRLMDAEGPRRLDAPGHRLERIGPTLVLTGGRGFSPPSRDRLDGGLTPLPPNLFRYPLSIPGEVELAEAGCVMSAEETVSAGSEARPGDPGAINGRGHVAIVRRDLCHGSLAVRNRRPGDRFHPPGLSGRKKLQDLFVDRKVRRNDRDRVPIVVDEADRIVWVAGFGIDEAFQVTDPGQAVLTLRLRPKRPHVSGTTGLG